MKKIICLIVLVFAIGVTAPAFAAPGGHHGGGPGGPGGPGGRPGHHHHGGMHSYRPHHINRPIHHHIGGFYHRPYHHYRPYYRPYYYPVSYYSSYTYYPPSSYEVVPAVSSDVGTVVVRDNYAGINTAANIVNAAANVATAIRFLSW